MRRRQPASLVISEQTAFGCRIRRQQGGMVLVTKQKENSTIEGPLGRAEIPGVAGRLGVPAKPINFWTRGVDPCPYRKPHG